MFHIVNKTSNQNIFYLFADFEKIILNDYKPVDMVSSNLKLKDYRKGDAHKYTASFGIYKVSFEVDDEYFSFRIFKGVKLDNTGSKLKLKDWAFVVTKNDKKDEFDEFKSLDEYVCMIFTFLLNYHGDDRIAYMSNKDKEYFFPSD